MNGITLSVRLALILKVLHKAARPTMDYARQHDAMPEKSVSADPFGADDPTVDCYNRRSRILMQAAASEWWIAIAVLLLIVGMGFVAI